ncbi:MAG TPA: chemotaxis protein CheB [Gemmatimonadaceae bacterium]|nr:chemotaxis protein CheB [Gemmatimonadaceae bacterium]
MPDETYHHDLIVIGGSAGAIEALTLILAGLPRTLPASICVVVHQPAYLPSRLVEVLSRVSPLPVVAAVDGGRVCHGVVYLALPDKHLMIEGSELVLRVVHGPKENRARPAVDPLFRSAALAAGSRTIGVILSGALDDGSAGLWAIRDRGGIAVAQDPDDAAVPSMPASAIAEVGSDHVVAARDMAQLLVTLVRQPAPRGVEREATEADQTLQRELGAIALDDIPHDDGPRYGIPSRFACPDCGGVLWDITVEGGPMRFRCETGHGYSPAALAETQTEGVEEALFAALRALEDKAELARSRAVRASAHRMQALAERFMLQAKTALAHGAAVRAALRLDGHVGLRPEIRGPHSDVDVGGDLPDEGQRQRERITPGPRSPESPRR